MRIEFLHLERQRVGRTVGQTQRHQLSLFEISLRKRVKTIQARHVLQNCKRFVSHLYLMTHWNYLWLSYEERHKHNDWSVMENMTDCEICPTALSEGTQLSRWDIRSSAASHFVLPTHYIFNCLHKYLACFEWNRGFISAIQPVLCIKYSCSWVLVTICALLNKEQANK
jgi:hypothetical protein